MPSLGARNENIFPRQAIVCRKVILSGNTINGTIDIAMTVYNASSGGITLWNEACDSLSVANGVFMVLLGSNSPLPNTVFDAPDRWLEINEDYF